MRGIHRGGGSPGAPPPEWEQRTQKTNVCFLITATRGSSWSLRACHSQPDELFFILHVPNDQRLGRYLRLLTAPLSRLSPPPGEKAAQNIIKSKYSTGGEAERLKRSHDRRLLAALIRFQCKRGGGGGGSRIGFVSETPVFLFHITGDDPLKPSRWGFWSSGLVSRPHRDPSAVWWNQVRESRRGSMTSLISGKQTRHDGK